MQNAQGFVYSSIRVPMTTGYTLLLEIRPTAKIHPPIHPVQIVKSHTISLSRDQAGT